MIVNFNDLLSSYEKTLFSDQRMWFYKFLGISNLFLANLEEDLREKLVLNEFLVQQCWEIVIFDHFYGMKRDFRSKLTAPLYFTFSIRDDLDLDL